MTNAHRYAPVGSTIDFDSINGRAAHLALGGTGPGYSGSTARAWAAGLRLLRGTTPTGVSYADVVLGGRAISWFTARLLASSAGPGAADGGGRFTPPYGGAGCSPPLSRPGAGRRPRQGPRAAPRRRGLSRGSSPPPGARLRAGVGRREQLARDAIGRPRGPAPAGRRESCAPPEVPAAASCSQVAPMPSVGRRSSCTRAAVSSAPFPATERTAARGEGELGRALPAPRPRPGVVKSSERPFSSWRRDLGGARVLDRLVGADGAPRRLWALLGRRPTDSSRAVSDACRATRRRSAPATGARAAAERLRGGASSNRGGRRP